MVENLINLLLIAPRKEHTSRSRHSWIGAKRLRSTRASLVYFWRDFLGFGCPLYLLYDVDPRASGNLLSWKTRCFSESILEVKVILDEMYETIPQAKLFF